MKWWYLLFIFTLSLGAQSAHSQKTSKRKAKKEQRDAVGTDQKNKDRLDSGLTNSRSRHEKIQDKKTRKRMKRSAKKQKKLSSGKTAPFYKRWFRKRRFK
jgi:hypothetical protein